MPALLMGATGWVSGLAGPFPAEAVAMVRLIKTGRIEDALAISRWYLPLLEPDMQGKLVQYLKLAETLTGMGTEYVRAPRLTLTGEEKETVLRVIRQCLETRPVWKERVRVRG
jgi:4-hydroxy-tetrahydrodipicolinate synthase